MRRPKIALLHYTFPSVPGGVEMVLARHAEGLRDAGADVTIVAGRGRVAIRGVRGVRVSEVDSRHPAVERVFRALARGDVPPELAEIRARLVTRLAPILRDADRVVAHNVLTLHKNAPLALALHDLARSFAPDRFVVWVHDIASLDPRYRRQLHDGEPWDVFRRPLPGARYVAVSASRRDEVAEVLRLPPGRIDVIPNGVDLDPLLRPSPTTRRLVAALGLDRADPLLLLPARLTRRKRIEVAIDAAAELRRRGGAALLLVTGVPGPHNPENVAYLEELRARAAASRGGALLLHDVAHRALPYRVVADLYALADALVFPSEAEGFGIPIVEAAIARATIVCSDIPAHRAIAGGDATYVPPDADAATLADAIEGALAGDRAARLRARARGRYAWERILHDQVVPLILGKEAPVAAVAAAARGAR